jgi:carbamate kinase
MWLWPDGEWCETRNSVGMRALIALGGNALLRRKEPTEASVQQDDVARAAEALAGVAAEHELVIAHGSGPQVEGMVGMLELALRNALPDRDLVTVLSAVVVSAEDPAFKAPSKPIGPLYEAEQAKRLAVERGWSIGPDDGGFRRLVASPEPQAIVELASLRTLIDAGVLLICAGGGGIPVALDGDGTMDRVEAVVEENLTASLLARRLDADVLVMLTDVDAVRSGWGTEDEQPLGKVTVTELREHDFGPGSIGPKVEAACRFVEATGRRAAIGELTKAVEIVRGESGTQISAPSV